MRTYITAALHAVLLVGTVCHAAPAQDQKGTPMNHATGTFAVKLAPHPIESLDPQFAVLTLDKQFSGELEGSSKGLMVSAGTEVKGSAGYVAMEKFSGTLSGHSGSFLLQHSGTMNRGVPHLDLSIVPDSGTGDLTGLAGSMQIIIEAGKHSYVLNYTLAH